MLAVGALPAAASPREPVDVIVTLEERPSVADLRALRARVGSFTVRQRFSLVPAFAATMSREQAARLARGDGVVRVDRDATVELLNDAPQEWFGIGRARVDLPAVNGSNLVAAVLDTGIDPGHRDLDEGKVIAFVDCTKGPCVPAAAYDDNGHGTHVAATLAGDGDGTVDRRHRGVAPGAALVGVKVTPANGVAVMSNVVAGLEWAVANKDTYNIRVLNLSLGFTGCWDGTDPASAAVDAAAARGLLVVVAAGNGGAGVCSIKSPGAAAGALTVGNVADPSVGGIYLSPDSSRGPTADGRAKPDLSAPGVGIVSAQSGTVDGYAKLSGTSMAAPFVAGLALLMLEVDPGLTSDALKRLLTDTAADRGAPGRDLEYGAGVVDPYAALRAAGAAPQAGPELPGSRSWQGTLGVGETAEYEVGIDEPELPLAATLVAASAEGRFELHAYDPSGALVRSSTGSSRQLTMSFTPGMPGAYRLRVVGVAAGSFTLDVSAGLRARTGNLLPNAWFETGFGSWRSYQGALSPAAESYDGTSAVRVTRVAGTTYNALTIRRTIRYTRASESFAASAWVRSVVPGRKVCVRTREWASDTGAQVATQSACRLTTTSWQRLGPIQHAVAGAGNELAVDVYQTGASGSDSFDLDAVSLVRSGGTPPPPADTTPPDTTITDGPPSTTTSKTATFAFTATEAGSSFACSVDGSAYAACSSPQTTGTLATGQHVFRVRATDAAGNVDASPAERTWTIESEPAPQPTTNLVPNPGFEGSLTGWKPWQATVTTAPTAASGAGAARVVPTAGVTSYSLNVYPRPIRSGVAGAAYTAAASIRSDVSGRTVCLVLRERDSTGGIVTSAKTCVVVTTAWQRFPSLRHALTVGGGELELFVQAFGARTGDSFDLDDVVLAAS